jgi:hypothetical protein
LESIPWLHKRLKIRALEEARKLYANLILLDQLLIWIYFFLKKVGFLTLAICCHTIIFVGNSQGFYAALIA